MKQPKIAKAFRTLRKLGYFARQNWMCCQGCGWAAVPDQDKVVFYHSQDREHFIETGNLYLSWSGDGEEIVKAFHEAGLCVKWDGDTGTRILVADPARDNQL
jgi:hypothetical protein